MGSFLGVVELVCGALIIVGLFTWLATIPLIVTMIVALIATKLLILLWHGFGPFSLPDFKRYGFWSAQLRAVPTSPCCSGASIYPLSEVAVGRSIGCSSKTQQMISRQMVVEPIPLVIEIRPHRSLADFGRKLVRCLARHGSTFSGVGAYNKPGRFTAVPYALRVQRGAI
ncbi:DoxX family protein [Sphingomonas sp. H160509]|uniref:DoxX family protein n=1 Tax=Sphingomonas sp. H160509 TaxID=2955313 RepID=UPI0021E997FC|nr:DoxX family protein [Sphingomonas sp. H160509]MDD1453000.1 DoxX family protein [Sphingomonas sp. H160509]